MRLEADEGGGGDGGWRRGGRESWRGSDVTTEIKSNANTKLHYPSRTLADPSSLRLALTLPPGTPSRPFLPVLSPSLRFSHPPPLIPPHLSRSSLFPHEIPPAVPRVWCAFSPASTSHLTDLIHPQRITPSSAAPAVSAAPPANLGETETIATPTSTRRD